MNHRSEDSSKTTPYLSVVVTCRNDNHGGNMLHRMEAFVHGLAYQCKRFQLDTELIVVEWNPIRGEKRLNEVIPMPQNNAHFKIRFIEIPGHIHNGIENAEKIPLYQMIAKNVGIRRARGEFILATAIDLLFSNELMWLLSLKILDPGCFYRVARYDVGKTEIPMDLSFEEQLRFCRQHLIRIHALTNTINVNRQKAPPSMAAHQDFCEASIEKARSIISEYRDDNLFTNACGDFTLMAREKWFDLRGYPEIPKWSIFIDGLLLHMAHVSGLHQVILDEPMRIYHIEHDTGWAVDQNTVKERPSLDYEKDYKPWCRQMLREHRVINPNDRNWGYAQLDLSEYVPDDTEKKAGTNSTVPPEPQYDDANEKAMYRMWVERISNAEKKLYYRDQTPETLQQLVHLARRHKPTRIVEIGTLSGMSLRAWIVAAVDANITAIDLSFRALEKSKRIVPLDLGRVTLLERDVLSVDFNQIWEKHDRVLLFVDAHDQPSVPIMRHLIDTAIAKLPAGSMVVVDDLWFNTTTLDQSSAENWFHTSVLGKIDPLQCFDGYFAPYWKGGSFFGFHEVLPLMGYINHHKIELSFAADGKTVWFEVPPSGFPKKNHNETGGRSNGPTGKVAYHPLAWIAPKDRSDEDVGALSRICEKAVVRYAEGDLESAFQCFSEAIQLKWAFPGAYYGLAVIMARIGEWSRALNLLQQDAARHCGIVEVDDLRTDLQNRLCLASPKLPMAEPARPDTGKVTLFTVPKPFKGHIDTIQRNAIKSWMLLEPRPEILILGNEEGVAAVAGEFGLAHLPDIAVNMFGTPLLDSIFAVAQSRSTNARMAYVNTDIILLQDFITALDMLGNKTNENFFMVGKRWDLEINDQIDFQNLQWDHELLKQIDEGGRLHASTGIDYFIFQKETLGVIKPFALGRTVWDNWLIDHALEKELPVVDASQVITAIHQNHDYQHLKGGKKEAWNGIEARQNLGLAGGYDHIKDISSASWVLTPQGMRPNVAVQPGRNRSAPKSVCASRRTKFSIIMIVLNGMPLIECALSSVYDVAHEIIIVEGAVEKCMFSANPDGSSTDGTVSVIESFPDPQHKIKLIQGRWPEKCEMQNKALEYVTGDYVWLVDSDEVYRKEDIAKITALVNKDPAISQINLLCHNFWKGFDYLIFSNKLFAPDFHFRRIFKFKPGARFVSHRPPTMVHPGSKKTTEQMRCVDAMSLWRQGVAIYHYSYVFDAQVKQKMELYRRYGWDKTWKIDMQRWYHSFYAQWTPGRRLELEKSYPVWTGDKASYSVPFKGKHPEAIKRFLESNPALQKPLARPFAMRHVVDAVEELLFRNLPGPPLTALETGTIRSYDEKHESTRHISRTLGRGGKLISVDVSPESIRISRDICQNADNVEWVQSDSRSYLHRHCPEKLHFVLLDSVNDQDAIFAEFTLIAPRMAPNGIVMIDDAGIHADGGGYDGSPAEKGRRIWHFLKECGAAFDVLETAPGHSTQIKVRFTPENARLILARMASCTGQKPEKPVLKSTAPKNTESAVQEICLGALQHRSTKTTSTGLHIVIDGVIFQLQAGRPRGISRVWRNLIQGLKRQMPRTKISVLQRSGFSVPVSSAEIYKVPSFELGGHERLDADDEMLRCVCRDLKADVFMSTYYTRAPGVVNVVMVHDMIPELFGFDLSQPEWQAKQRAIETGDAFLCVSRVTQNDLLRCYPQRVRSPMAVVPNGLDPGIKPVDQTGILELRKKLDLTRDYVLLVGNRRGYKGGDGLMKALSQLPSNTGFTVLCVGGEGQPSPEELRIKSKMDLRDAGQLTDSELAAAYSGAQALFVPSKYEGFGLPVIEAMACGCPVIAEKSPAVEEVGGDAVYFADLSSPDGVRQALQKVGEPTFREKMTAKGRVRATGYDWDKAAGRIGQFVETLMAKPSVLLTAVVSTFNSSRFIKGCLEDLEHQTIADRLEIIVIDSASEQDEGAVVRDFQRRHPNIKYIRTTRRESVYRSWNRGIKFARGKYISNANTDDRHRPDAFEQMVHVMEQDKNIALVYADVIKTRTANETFRRCTPTGMLRWYDWDRRTLLEKGCFIGPQPVWRKAVHQDYGYFDDNYEVSADFEFWLRISQTNQFYHISKPLGLYMDRPDSIEHGNARKKGKEDQEILQRYRQAAREKRAIGMIGSTSRSDRHLNTESHRIQQDSAMNAADLNQCKKATIEAEDLSQGGHGKHFPEILFKSLKHLFDNGHREAALWAMGKWLADFPEYARVQKTQNSPTL